MRDRDDSTDSDDSSKQNKRSKKQTWYQQQLDRISHQLDDQQQLAREHSDRMYAVMQQQVQQQGDYFSYLKSKDVG